MLDGASVEIEFNKVARGPFHCCVGIATSVFSSHSEFLDFRVDVYVYLIAANWSGDSTPRCYVMIDDVSVEIEFDI